MKIKNIEIKIIRGDIAQVQADAIVNPANPQLRMEKGLAGFLKKEGGAVIEEEALSKGPVKPGEAVWTKAGTLRSRYIIHAVTVSADGRTDETILREAAAGALRCANERQISSVVFPALGCGEGCEASPSGGNFPPVGAAKIIAQEIIKCARDPQNTLTEITFCLYDQDTFETFDKTIRGYVRHIVEDLGGGPFVTVDIIIECVEGIILIERSNPPYGWALPGGFVDYGESLEKAALREAKEETNLDLVDLRQFHTYSEPGRDPRFHTISTVFIAEGQGEPRAGDDAKGVKVVRYEDLLELDYAFDHKEIIEEYLVERDFD